jgi:biopolymer transport protein ExbB
MRTTTITTGILLLALHAAAQQPAQEGALSRLAGSAEQELARSIQELNALRESIATEKLPLAQELTALEEQVTRLRREHEKISRSVDEGNLELVTVKGKIKARQDELDYVGNLLDEYARALETKVNVSELQYLGEAIQSAKQATEDGLPATEKFDRQAAVVDLSLKRMTEAIGGMVFPGVGVDLEGTVADGRFTLVGPVALFMATAGAAGLVVPQSGSTKPLIRPLEGAMQAGIVSLLQSGEGLLPLDPSLGGALKALVQKTSLVHIFEKGGPIMWPLLAASILALGTVLERVFFLMREKLKRDPKALEAFFAAVGRGDAEEAIRVSKATKFYVVRALGYALAHKENSLASALLYSQAQELKRFQRGVPILDTVITLAPLLGLLGTVTGMMGSFSLIGGELSAPGAITGGIAEALIATAFGLGIAITALLPFNFLNARTEEARHEMESAATQLELLVQPALAVAREAQNGKAASRGELDEEEIRDRAMHRKRMEIRRQIASLQAELEGEFDGRHSASAIKE